MPGVDQDRLLTFALLALEEALQDSRYPGFRRTVALRLALAYLFTLARDPQDRRHFDDYWRSIGGGRPWSLSSADGALGWIYKAIGVKREDALSWSLWRVAQRRHEASMESSTPPTAPAPASLPASPEP